MMRPPSAHPVLPVTLTPWSWMAGHRGLIYGGGLGAPASGTLGVAACYFYPIHTLEPYPVAKAFVLNGATVGTDSWDLGVYRLTAAARLDAIRTTGLVLSQGTTNACFDVSAWKVAKCNITTGVDSTDATTYTTASVTLKAGRLYLMSFVNTAASAAAISGIAGGPTWTSRGSTQYNTAAHRVSVWSGVPTVDYTGTIVVTFGATQTSGRWSLNEFSGVDTATNDGVVQVATNTGNDTTPIATLAAFGSANNATFGALANTADSTTTPGSGFTELSDLSTSTTPASFLQTEWRVDNDTTVDGTITSGQWGAIAAEIKADASPFVIPAETAEPLYMGFLMTGTTATIFRTQGGAGGSLVQRAAPYYAATLTAGGLDSAYPTVTGAGGGGVGTAQTPVVGFSLRSLLA